MLSLQRTSRSAFAGALASILVGLYGCTATVPAVKPVATPGYAELMSSADEAQKGGGTVEAVNYFEQAAKADPAKKQPWLRIAQIRFDEHNYGAAISSAQEVLQRDNSDVTAKSIMAVSGLRVSASALDQLRQINAVNGNTRDEAQTLAKTMRDALGESIFPVVAPPENSKGGGRPVPRKQPIVPATSTPSNVVPPAKPSSSPEQKRNPFEALKG